MLHRRIYHFSVLTILCLLYVSVAFSQVGVPALGVSSDGHFLQTKDGKPFFWLGDTGWLLFVKLTREETIQYLDTRKSQGYNVVQAMVIHDIKHAKNRYGKYAIQDGNIAKPIVTKGANPSDSAQYDFWDHVDYVVKEAGKRGMYIALVPLWGSNVKDGKVSVQQVTVFARFLAERYKSFSNIVWMNGGDIKGSDGMAVWQAIGNTIKKYDPNHLMTFHPRGRYSSSEWFQHAAWLDFNIFQSGHRDYAQDTSTQEKNHFGEDNWKYVKVDYHLQPTRPVLDGEPSYENIPHGLHDSLQARWTAQDLRRYAYWSVFAGGAGFTYGENAVMQFHVVKEGRGSFGVRDDWQDVLNAPAATQMHYLKDLILRYSYFDRKPAQEILVNNVGRKYHYLLATMGKDFALVYTYCGDSIQVDVSRLNFKLGAATWLQPATGKELKCDFSAGKKIATFIPPGASVAGNDWVLILKK
ncbi:MULTISPECIES: glycoside hydrolase family 140 protein [Chitinophagaceae]